MSNPNQPPYGPQPGQPGPGGQPPQGQPPYGQPQGQPPSGQPPYGQPQPGFTPPNYGGQQRPGSYPTPPPPGGYPNQPGPGGYPPQPGQPGGPGQPGERGPGAPGGVGQPPGAKKGSGGRIGLIIGAIVLALVIIGVGAAVLLNRNNDTVTGPIDPPVTGGTDPTGGSAPPTAASTTAPPPVSTQADQAVKSYLEALAAGQAGVALSLGKDQPTDKTFLTDAVLADSNKRAPITEITVSPADNEFDSSIEASYKLGDQQVNENFTVQKTGDNYLLYDVAADINLETIRSRTLPLLINGVEVKSDTVYLFPGSYALSSGSKYVNYGDGALEIKSPNDYANAYEKRPEITDAGAKALTVAAKAKLAACAKEVKFKPSGCSFLNIRENSGQNITESSIRRKITEDPFTNVEPRTDYQDPAIAEFGITVRWEATASGTQNGRRASFTVDPTSDYVTVRARMTSDPLKVVFR